MSSLHNLTYFFKMHPVAQYLNIHNNNNNNNNYDNDNNNRNIFKAGLAVDIEQ